GEHYVGALEPIAWPEAEVGAAAKRRMHAVEALARQALGGHLGHLDAGVIGKQAEELTTGIAGAAHNPGAHHGARSTLSSRSTSPMRSSPPAAAERTVSRSATASQRGGSRIPTSTLARSASPSPPASQLMTRTSRHSKTLRSRLNPCAQSCRRRTNSNAWSA